MKSIRSLTGKCKACLISRGISEFSHPTQPYQEKTVMLQKEVTRLCLLNCSWLGNLTRFQVTWSCLKWQESFFFLNKNKNVLNKAYMRSFTVTSQTRRYSTAKTEARLKAWLIKIAMCIKWWVKVYLPHPLPGVYGGLNTRQQHTQ